MDKPSDKRLTILVVDDSEINRALLSTIFSDDYRVEEAADGVEALVKLRSLGRVAAVILDLMMPKLDGYGVLKEMNADPKLKLIPSVVVTGSNDLDSQLKALDAGAVDVIVKPFNSLIVLHRVRNVVQRSIAAEEAEHSKLLEQRLQQSETDSKTGIYNKQAFCTRTSEMLMQNPDTPYSLLIWDIGRFKMFNDRYGTAAGDRYLRSVGRDYQKNAGPDMSYGRIESDHFAICMPTQLMEEEKVADKILGISNYKFEGFDLISRVGIYQVEDHAMDIVLMLDRAMLALQSVKGNYDKRVGVYDESMRRKLVEEQEIISDMDAALRLHQFVVYLQPQCDYMQKTLHGAEALVRWVHPTKGVIMPDHFIPVFERNGFITKMDAYIWEAVCKLQRKWLDQGLKAVPISVNISRRDISTLQVAEIFTELTDKYHLKRDLIRCEVTESAYIQDHDLLVKTVKELQQAGFSVEMDDFGSGYSSLNFLKDVPVDMLKLDMKFLAGSENENRSGSILTSVIRMANWIQLPVIAEGVETRQQADYLKSVGCAYIQGYFYAKPMPVKEFEKFLKGVPAEKKYTGDYYAGIKGAEDYLSASTQATMLFNSFVGGAAIIEFDGLHVEALRLNEKFYEELGTSPKDYGTRRLKILERFDEQSQIKYIAAVREAIRTNQESTCIACSKPLTENGMPIYTRNSFRFLVGNAGRYILYLSVQNITEFMSLLNRNTELKDQLSAIMNSVPGGIQNFEVSGDHIRMTYFNDTMPAMFGYTREEYEQAFGNDFRAALNVEDAAKLSELFASLDRLASGKPIELRHILQNGSWKWIRMRTTVLRRDQNSVLVTAATEDIDDWVRKNILTRRQADELEHQRISLQMLYDTMPCGIMLFSGEPDQPEQRLGFNDMVWKLYGYDSREQYLEAVRSSSAEDSIYPDDLPQMQKTVQMAIRTGQPQECEHRIVKRDGSIRWLRSVIQNVKYSDGSRITQVLMMDISEHKSESAEKLIAALFKAYDRVYEVDTADSTATLRMASLDSSNRANGTVAPLQQHIDSFIHHELAPEDRRRFRQFIHHAASADSTHSRIEYRTYSDADGYKWYAAEILRTGSDSYLLCSKNIAKRKHAQEQEIEQQVQAATVNTLLKEEEMIRLFVEATGMIWFDYDPHSDTLHARYRGSDRKAGDRVADHFMSAIMENDWISAADREYNASVLKEVLASPRTEVLECHYNAFGNGYIRCQIQMTSLGDEAGNVVRVVGIMKTAEKKTDDHLLGRLYEITGVDYSSLTFQKQLVSDTLDILNNAADTTMAANSVLASVGERFGLSRTYLFEENPQATAINTAYEWSVEGVRRRTALESMEHLPEIRKSLIRAMDDHNDMLAYSDVNDMPEWMKPLAIEADVKATAIYAVRQNGIFRGYAGFDICHDAEWTAARLNTLRILVRVMAEFLQANHTHKEAELPKEVRQAVESSKAYVYILDPDTCEVLYANDALTSEIGKPMKGMPCYRSMMNESSMCKVCPMRMLKTAGAPVPVELSRDGKKYVMQAAPFLWYGRKAVLVSGSSESTFMQSPETVRETELNNMLNRYVFTLSIMYDQIVELDYTNDTYRVLVDKNHKDLTHIAHAGFLQIFEAWSHEHLKEEDRTRFDEFLNFRKVRESFRLGKLPEVSAWVKMDGEEDCYAVSVLLQLNAGRYLCCTRDMTESVQNSEMKEQLHILKAKSELQDLYRTLVDETRASVVEHSHADDQYVCTSGFQRYALKTEDLPNLLPKCGSDKDSRSTGALLRLKMKDGSNRWTRVSATRLYDAQGQLTRTIGVFQDVDAEMNSRMELEKIRDRMQHIVSALPTGVGIYEIDDNKAYPVYSSDRVCEIFGCSREEMDMTIANGQEQKFKPVHSVSKEQIDQLRSGAPVVFQKLRMHRANGTGFWLRVFCSMSSGTDGRLYCYAIMEDITEEVENSQTVMWQSEEYRMLSEASDTIMFDYVPQTDIMRIHMPDHSGLKQDREISHTNYLKNLLYAAYIGEEERPILREALTNALQSASSATVDFRAIYDETGERWYRAKFASLADEEGRVFRVVGRLEDINDIILKQEALRTEAEMDQLTGLYNKNCGTLKIQKAIRERKQGQLDAIMFMDMDDFKEINDSCGHFEADKLLKKFGALLTKTFRKGDIIMRFGGDEFAVYLIDVGSMETAEHKAELILQEAEKIKTGKIGQLRVSIGIAAVRTKASTYEKALSHADSAMYQAKRTGKSKYCVYSTARTKKEQ